MNPTETLANGSTDTLVLPVPFAALTASVTAYALVHYRYQPERTATVLPVAVRLGAPADLLAPVLQLHLSLDDAQRVSTLTAEAAQQIRTALAALPPDWEPAMQPWHLQMTPDSADTPPAWESKVTFLDDDVTFAVADRPATAGHLQAVFEQLGPTTETTVGRLQFLGTAELMQLAEFAQSPVQLPAGAPARLHEWFEASVQQYPTRPALLGPAGPVSYRELDERANALADYLRATGVQPGDFVGLFIAKSTELYVAMLAVLKAGAAYVPLDLSFPAERVAFILSDCGARLLLTAGPPPAPGEWAGTALNLHQLPAYPAESRPAAPAPVLSPDSPAYVIYTSGTTGLPKGVVLPHRSIGHLVQAEQALFQPTADDRVAQGFSVAFDASLEEIWLAWAAGAALVPVPDEVMKAPDALPAFLLAQGVTVFSTVPTLLSLLDAPVATVRLLILGGEVCPAELLTAWGGTSRRIVNTYGPTEATVIATSADYVPGRPLTIGRPVPGYVVRLLDQAGQAVAPGLEGEICLGGAALATGYLNRPELTASKFIEADAPQPALRGRFYRTGDLGRFTTGGEVEFLGRIDTQVKLRGYRIELAEIEALLLQFPGVRNAAVALKTGPDDVPRLIAYLILAAGHALDEAALRPFLRTRLAAYMVPALFVEMGSFPALTSGKVDRKALPYPQGTAAESDRVLVAPRTPAEAALLPMWQQRFGTKAISVIDDFFDLGGNSLLASLLVSELRRRPEFAGLSVRDLYAGRTIEGLARCAVTPTEADAPTTGFSTEPTATSPAASTGVRAVTAGLQLLSATLFYALPVTTLLFSLRRTGMAHWHWLPLLGLSLASLLAYLPLYGLLVVAVKWLVIGRFRAGNYPLWGFYYLRFWLVKKAVESVPAYLLTGTPYLNAFYRLLGAHIGPHVHLNSNRLLAFDLITIGAGASIAPEAGLLGYRVEAGRLLLGPIEVGENAYVGLRAVLRNNSRLGAEAVLEDLSALAAGHEVPAYEVWAGSPARRVRTLAPADCPPVLRPGQSTRLGFLALQTGALLLVQLLPAGSALPVVGLFYEAVLRYGWLAALALLLPLSTLYVVLSILVSALFVRVGTSRRGAATHSLYSRAYVQQWFVDAILAESLRLLRPLYATIYTPFYLRLLGARIGRRAEVSTLNHLSVDQLTVGAEAFLADSVSIGAPRVQRGVLTIAPTVIGARSFIGNSAVVPGGTTLGSGVLIGALSTAPATTPADDTSWVGSPAFALPNRPVSHAFPASLTFAPPRRLVLARGLIEFFKITLPYCFAFLSFGLLYHYCVEHPALPFWRVVLGGTGIFLTSIFSLTLLTVALKWTIIGRYVPAEKPLWSSFVWRSELVNSLCESYVYPFWEALLLGTPFAAIFFRWMGSDFGKRVYLDTTEITEFDLAHVGDQAELASGVTVQTHLFEDRVMKMSHLRIGAGASVGVSAVVLYDSEMEAGARLRSLSLLMKGERLPAHTTWQGIPCSFVP
ncbi:Pls/PosA family non-ribosomal peptide synthetase [Hymenobacter siberiensis]|uniref:Pls/PosA family non-ribosomal peptide synthetase n=1 Tax=Hymenobacter siberiensis TaxID=2848396 RepID=UPI001C1DE975|nr:Pls/PosA family non-ribosomal peptide synthetase [Hymenobacter siberiensis]